MVYIKIFAILPESVMFAFVRAFENHCLWFLVKNANAFAPISEAFNGAFCTPPSALT